MVFYSQKYDEHIYNFKYYAIIYKMDKIQTLIKITQIPYQFLNNVMVLFSIIFLNVLKHNNH